jgi:antirestriction protein ArdC
MAKHTKPKKDLFEEGTRSLLEIINKGTLPWSKGRLQLGAKGPTNFNTGKAIQGL